jgi:hypothetical protein
MKPPRSPSARLRKSVEESACRLRPTSRLCSALLTVNIARHKCNMEQRAEKLGRMNQPVERPMPYLRSLEFQQRAEALEAEGPRRVGAGSACVFAGDRRRTWGSS